MMPLQLKGERRKEFLLDSVCHLFDMIRIVKSDFKIEFVFSILKFKCCCCIAGLLQTCQQVLDASEGAGAGVHMLDLDGTDPLPAFSAQCLRASSSSAGYTLIETQLQDSPNTTNHLQRFHIDYRNVDKHNVQQLAKFSTGCYQYIGYLNDTQLASNRSMHADLQNSNFRYIHLTKGSGQKISYLAELFQQELCGQNQSRYDCLADLTMHKLANGRLSALASYLPLAEITVPAETSLVIGPLMCYGGT